MAEFNEEYYKLKLLAFLHDPPEKALNIRQHEQKSENYLCSFFDCFKDTWQSHKQAVHDADVWASVADRLQLPSGRQSEFYVKDLKFVHPLSGKVKDLAVKEQDGRLISKINNETIRDVLIEEFKNQQVKFERDYKKLYFHTWYALKNRLAASFSGCNLLPADTRNPAHTIFNHMDLTAAFAGASVNPQNMLEDRPCLFTFWTQGIQDFIAGARATRDLWAGSYYLSWLIANVMAMFVRDLGPDCILAPEIRHQQMISRLVFENDEKSFSEEELAENFGFKGERLNDFCDPEKFFIPNLPNNFTALVPESYLVQIKEKITACLNKLYSEIATACCSGFKKDYSGPIEKHEVQVSEADFIFDMQEAVSWDYAAVRIPLDIKEYCSFYKEQIKSVYGINDEFHNLVDLVQMRGDLIDKNIRYGKGKKEYSSALWPLLVQHLAHLRNQNKKVRHFRNKAGANKDKCTLTGFSEVVGPLRHGECREFWKACHERTPIIIHKSEKLGPLGIIKRFFFKYYLEKRVGDRHNKKLDYLRFYPSLEEISISGFKFHVGHLHQKNETKIILDLAYELYSSFKLLSDELAKNSSFGLGSSEIFDDFFRSFKTVGLEDIFSEYQQNYSSCKGLNELFKMSAFWFGKKSFSEELVDNYGRNIDLNGIVTEEINNLLVSFRKACSEFQKVSFSRQTNEMSPETLPEVQPFHSVGKYYAVLFFDGDSLSKWLSADSSVALSMLETIHPDIKNAYTEEIKKWSKENKQKFELMSKFCAVTPGYHKSISEALANFSLGLVKKIVEKRFLGRLIYSGGDDVLAILPPEMAFHCAKELRRVFSLDFVETKDIDNVPTSLLMGNKASASAGIVICPLKYPFGYALEKARQAEQKAKQNGRDSFYLELCNTSGDGLGFVDKWGEINAGKNSSFENLLRFFLAQLGYGSESDKLAQQGLSIKFPYELRKSLSDLCSAENPHFGELMKMEVERILKQQRYGFPKKESFDKEEREEQKKQAQKMTDQFVEKFKELWNSPFIKNAESKDESKGKLENKFLKLMDFFNFVLRLYRMSGEETQ